MKKLNGVNNMPKGTVKWFNGRKGFGFIEPDNGEDDVFVHVTAVKDSGLDVLNEGDKVSFELVENKGRMAAEKLSMPGDEESTNDSEDQVEDNEEVSEESE